MPFSRYELIEILGWPQSGASYRRIEEALHRWVGVVLMYENAWWDNTEKSWVDENFHVLDNVTLYDRERRKRAGGKAAKPGAKPAAGQVGPRRLGAEGDPLPLSSFRWNEVIFESFQSGNLKQLDLEFYLKLRLPTTKRMFRFLDKRFYRRARLDFDLRTLACEHIGMSRSYAPTELKRRLRPALEELEQLGFLEPLDAEERYSWVARGCWRIILIRSQAAQPEPSPPTEKSALVDALTARGVVARTAADLVEAHPPGRLRTKLEVFDWLVKNEDKRVGKNPAGYLVASIRSDYQPPEEYARRGQGRGGEEAGRRRRPQGQEEGPRRLRPGQGPRGRPPRPLGQAVRARARGDPRRRPGRKPGPRPLEEHARAPLPGRARRGPAAQGAGKAERALSRGNGLSSGPPLFNEIRTSGPKSRFSRPDWIRGLRLYRMQSAVANRPGWAGSS